MAIAVIVAASLFSPGTRRGRDSAAGASLRPLPPTAPGLRQPHRPPQPGEVRDLTIPELANFNYDAASGATIPQDVLRLSGMKVRLHGFMILTDQSSSITHFILLPSLCSCCYARPIGVSDTIVVHCDPGSTVSLSRGMVAVTGILTVRETWEDGYLVSLFRLDDARVGEIPG